jgi:putative protease
VGNSGNRGRCSQACREEYETTETGHNFPLNIKDNSAFFDLPALIEAGVTSFKIEGRIKGASYVHTVVDSFRKQIDGFVKTGQLLEDGERLYKVFNRDFSNAFLRGDLNQSMFIDNPRDNSKNHAIAKTTSVTSGVTDNNLISVVQIQEVEQTLYQEKNEINDAVKEKIQYLSIDKIPLTLSFSGEVGSQLSLTVIAGKSVEESLGKSAEELSTPHTTDANMPQVAAKTFVIQSTSLLTKSEHNGIDQVTLEKRFRALGNAEYVLKAIDLQHLSAELSVPFSELTSLKNEAARLLNGAKALLPAVTLPALERHAKNTGSQTDSHTDTQPQLSILISDESDIHLTEVTTADIYFKLPDAYKRDCTKYIDFLKTNPRLIPWFPAVLIGKDYAVAINILEQVAPALIVTNNTGIAYRANQLGIKWIAGPFLNTTNSYALMAMKEEFDCSGAFISNELNQQQMKNIARPANFKLFYSIYHPILLMTSRQCFFQQSVGCEKPRIDNGCMLSCDKSTSITNLKGVSFAIDKQKAGYPSIYNQDQFLNMQVINDLADLFDGFLIDLTNIGAGDKPSPDKVALISQFEQLLAGDPEIKTSLNTMVTDSTVSQYHTGL